MDPILGAVAVSAVSSLVQGYNAEKARGANKKKMKELEAAFNAIVPPEYDISINDPPQYITQSLQGANLDFSRITPEQFKVVGTYSPESAQFVAEQRPELVKGTEAQKEGRDAQIQALRQMQEISRGESPELRIAMQRAADQAQAEAQSRQQSLLQDAQRRGQAGSGLTFAAALGAGQQAMQTGATQSQNAALAAYKDKLAAMQSAGQMGRQLSQDELSQEAGNVDILNAFNQRTTKAYQDYQQQRAAMQNQAQMFNLEQQQDIANRNVGSANEAARYNLENRNRLAQQAYSNQVSERDYQNKLAESKANWAAQEKARQNQLKGMSYQDQLARASGKAGLGYRQMDMNNQQAADRNAMIGGVAGAGTGYFAGEQARADQKLAHERELERINAQNLVGASNDARWDKYYKQRYPDMAGGSYNTNIYA